MNMAQEKDAGDVRVIELLDGLFVLVTSENTNSILA